jgi:murein DD-endopeptidase MepM/ murein hydrolase activator NlpD
MIEKHTIRPRKIFTAEATILLMLCLLTVAPATASAGSLIWPIGCIPGIDCLAGGTFSIGYPDIDADGRAFDCGAPGYLGHTGTDISVTSVDDGVPVLAADDGEVLWVSGGKFDRCPDPNEPDCNPELQRVIPGLSKSSPSCNDFGPSCGADNCCLSWGFNAGNFILIMHQSNPESAITFYAHLRKGSIIVANGQRVKKGEKIAEVGSSGASLVPHLHFGVWSKIQEHYELADPWAGRCGPNVSNPLWEFSPPYRASVSIVKKGTGSGIVASTDSEFNCGSTCYQPVAPGTVVTLRATPYSGSEFVGWQGGCAGKGNNCRIEVEGAMNVTATFRDISPPTIRSVAIPTFSTTLTVPVNSFSAHDNIEVSGYLITESPAPPLATFADWHSDRPSSYTCSSPGDKTLYAWAKDRAGNVSSPFHATVSCGAFAAALPTPAEPRPASPRLPTFGRPSKDGT